MGDSTLTPLRGSGLGAGQRSQRYPTPFLDIASFYQPRTIKSLFRWCRLYMYSNPVISGVVRKKAQYPITGLKYKTKDPILKDKWRRLFEEHMRLKSHLGECSLDVQGFGNAFSSIFFPHHRYLVCPQCNFHTRLDERAKFEWKEFQFRGDCKRCDAKSVVYRVRDVTYRYGKDLDAPCDIKLVRWNPEQIEIDHVHLSGQSIYTFVIDSQLYMKIRAGHLPTLQTYPIEFFDAVKKKSRRVRIQPGRIYHWKRPGLSSEDMAWGEPAIMSSLKHLFVMSIFIKAREQIAHQHVIPLWVLFPQPVGNVDPLRGLDLADWRSRVEGEIQKWLQNPNYIPIMPIPLGSQFIGGNSAKLSVVEDIKALEGDILVGLMVPPEFAYSGSWSGSSIAIRLLENEFIHTQEDLAIFVNRFVVPRLARHTGWLPIELGFSDLRLQDDVQRKNFYLALQREGMLSRHALLSETNEDYEDQRALIEVEQDWISKQSEKQLLAQAKAQGEAERQGLKNQAKLELERRNISVQIANEMHASGADPAEIAIIQQKLLNLDGSQDMVGAMGALSGNDNGNGNGAPGTKSPTQNSSRFAGQDGQYSYFKMDINQQMPAWVQQVMSLPSDKRDIFIQNLQKQYPVFAQALLKEITALRSGDGIDMRPMPEQKPPRRASLA
jgi:hypothetical protein